MKDNIVLQKSKDFAIKTIKFYRWMCDKKKEFILSKQILKSGTSIGANVRESVNAQSKSDFISKINIALKESNETQYRLEIMHGSGLLSFNEFESMYKDCEELSKLLSAIVKSSKKKVIIYMLLIINYQLSIINCL